MNDFNKIAERAVNDAVEKYLPQSNLAYKKLIDSMRYSVDAGGKRVRPRLVFEFALLCGGTVESAAPFACAVELIHTYSLIHDDLPCMDDDDLRRGKPSNHIKFGEDIALLAGDALQALAFEIITSDEAAALAGDSACRKAANILAGYSGAHGMVGGQAIDLQYESLSAPVEILREMDYKKTACLIKAACELGAVSAGASEKLICAASEYGECIGIAFQIKDDILDVTSTSEALGKPAGSDVGNGKSTYVSLLGVDECNRLVDSLTEQAVCSLGCFGKNAYSLEKFARELAERNG